MIEAAWYLSGLIAGNALGYISGRYRRWSWWSILGCWAAWAAWVIGVTATRP